MPERKEPGAAHQALMLDLKGVCKRYHDNGMPPVEQLAVLAQLVGQVVGDVDETLYETSTVMETVARNIAAGNQVANDARGPSSGLVGFGGGKLS